MYRKIQIVGGKTYSVNLPIEWIKSMGLNKGSNILLTELDNGSILIKPPTEKKKLRPKIFQIVTSETLSRDITRGYLLGFEQIVIKSNKASGFSRGELDDIELARSKFPGAEIMTEGKNEMMIEIIASIEKNDPKKLIRRIFNLTQDMLERIANILNPKKNYGAISYEEELNRIRNIDLKINRTYFLIVRQLRALIQDSTLRREITTLKIMDFRLISHLLESIGDNCVHICDHIIEFQNLIKPLLEKEYDPDEKIDVVFDGLVSVAQKVKEYHNETFDSFIINDHHKAAEIIQKTISFSNDKSQLLEDFKSRPNKAELSIIIHRFYDIFDMIIDICDFIQPEDEDQEKIDLE